MSIWLFVVVSLKQFGQVTFTEYFPALVFLVLNAFDALIFASTTVYFDCSFTFTLGLEFLAKFKVVDTGEVS